MTQQGENEMVMKELELLEEDANVFKMIGPVLVKQDLVEAKANVGKRLDYIKGELSRMETGLKSLEKKRNDKEKEVRWCQISWRVVLATQSLRCRPMLRRARACVCVCVCVCVA
jgi:prefoldin beta subunit